MKVAAAPYRIFTQNRYFITQVNTKAQARVFAQRYATQHSEPIEIVWKGPNNTARNLWVRPRKSNPHIPARFVTAKVRRVGGRIHIHITGRAR